MLREHFPGIKLIVPGTYTGEPQAGQARTGTPANAMRLGATWLVVGREVINATNPVAALDNFIRNMCKGMFPDSHDDLDCPDTSC